MKRLFTFLFLVIVLVGTMYAQDKTTMLEVHDFTGFANQNQGTSINWGEQTGDDLNSSWDKVTLLSITGNVNGVSTTRNYYSWIDGKPRFSVGRDSDWQYWDNGWQMTQENAKTFFINRLDAGDKVTIEYRTDQTLHMISETTSLAAGDQIISGQEFTVNSAGGVEIECSNQWAVIYRVTIATKHLATYVIDHQTYTFTSGGVLPDKRKAVPYITMTFGNENMDYAYVRYYGEENGVKQFGSFMLTETMDDTYFKDFFNGQDYYQNEQNWNNANGPYVLKEPVVFKGGNFDEYVPWHGTYYYFYPETNGKLYVHMHSDPVTSHNNWGNDPMFLWDKTTNDGRDASSFDYNTEGFYKFGSNPQNGVRVKKDHVYFMCTTPNDPRRRNVAHLTDYTFVPDFTMTPLYKVIENGYEPQTSGEIAVSDLMYTDNNPNLHYRVKKCLGNIESAEVEIKNNKLYFTNITYKSGDNVNKGGSVIVDVDCTDGQADFVLTVPYSAEPSDNSGKQVQTWDFYNNILDDETVGYNYDESYEPFKQANEPLHGKQHLGQYSNTGSGLYYETHEKVPGEWLNTYIDLENSKEPIFKNVYDMEGDNADMIWDTNGLIIHAHSGTTGFYNENGLPTSGFSDRFLGFMPGSKLVIPRLKANDRVVIKMGCYGNADNTVENKNAILKLTNAKDAVGTVISDDYIIGGSMPYPDETGDAKTQPHGEYHFIVASTSTSEENDFAIEVAEGTDLLKIYSITIYTNDDIVTENELQNSKGNYQIINTTEYTHPDNLTLQPHYRGLNEPTNYVPEHVVVKSGNLQATDIDCSGDPDTYVYTFYVTPLPTAANPKFGVFVARQGVQTTDQAYVTDYADRMIPVGFRETQTYPYTWDFTDLKKYVSIKENDDVTDGIDANGNELQVTDNDLKIWKNWNLRVKADEWDGNIFASGGQLYGGTTMFEETKGIGITHDNNNVMSMTGDGSDLSGGLSVGNGAYGFIVPQVEKGQAIYVRASKVGDTQQASLEKSNGNPTYTYGQTTEGFTYTGTADNGDAIFAYAVTSTKKIDVRLNFKGYEVKKIAVATDQKAVNSKGWTSESRNHDIDASLLPYFTGKEMKTYVVSDPNYTERTLTLTDVGAEAKCVIPAGKGCLIYNPDNGAFNPFGTDESGKGDGFHLFVPDMHDQTGKTSTLANLLVANVTEEPLTLGMFDDGNVNYVLAYKYQLLTSDGTPYGDVIEGPEMFYRVSKNGIKLHKNSAYLQLPKAEVMPSPSRPAGCPMFSFIFTELDEGETVITGIEEAGVLIEDEETNAVWYNLNGQKLNGKPSARGIYIRNGKKVFVK